MRTEAIGLAIHGGFLHQEMTKNYIKMEQNNGVDHHKILLSGAYGESTIKGKEEND